MESLFETITKNLPKATEEQKRQLAELEPAPVQGVGYDKMPGYSRDRIQNEYCS